MPCSWTLHALDMPFAAFLEAPNIWSLMTFMWLLFLIVGVGTLERKLDRIMKHLGLEEKSPKRAPTARLLDRTPPSKSPAQDEV